MKRIIAIFVTVLLIFAALPVSYAEETNKLSSLEQEVIQEARDTYIKAQRFAGKSSFHGKCGLFVGTQLRCLGINTKRICFDGNDSYDYYARLDMTTGGYYALPYSAEEYDLLGALQAVSDNGKRNVRNILVGFQWTNTQAGRKFGHVMLINGIINGTVYFVESFGSALGGPEGTVLQCSMETFANSYNKWTRFDGLVHFGAGNYYDVCQRKTTDLTVQARFSASLRSQPALEGKRGCEIQGTVAPGERFRATAIFNDGRSQYYQVETEAGIGFVSCNAMHLLKVNEAGVVLTEETFSNTLKAGKTGSFSGTVTDTVGQIDYIEVCITNSADQPVRWEMVEVGQENAQLSRLRGELFFDLLEADKYRVDIYVIRGCPAVSRGSEGYQSARILLKSYPLQVDT